MGSVYAHTLQTTVSAFGLILCHLPAHSHESCTKPDQLDSGFNDTMMELSRVVFLDMQLITVFFSWVVILYHTNLKQGYENFFFIRGVHVFGIFACRKILP